MATRDSTRHWNYRHGYTGTRTHEAWRGMISRCTHNTGKSFKWYKGRGITFDPRWAVFENFLADMGEAPEGLQLDRIDNDGNYCKANCRWVTASENAKNRRNARRLEYKGVTYSQKDLAALAGIRDSLLCLRLSRGWSIEEAVETKKASKWHRRKQT